MKTYIKQIIKNIVLIVYYVLMILFSILVSPALILLYSWCILVALYDWADDESDNELKKHFAWVCHGWDLWYPESWWD